MGRAQIHIHDNTSRIIGETEDGTLSLRVAAIAARYEAMCQSLMPPLTKDEWCAVFDANNGTDVLSIDGHIMPAGVWANVADSVGLDKKWNIDSSTLVSKLQALSPAALLAVEEASIRFWMNTHLSTDAAIAASWANLTEKETGE